MFVRVTISWRLHCLSKTYVGPSTFLTYTEALFFVCLPVPYWTKFMSHLIQVRWMKIAAACDELRTFTKMLWRNVGEDTHTSILANEKSYRISGFFSSKNFFKKNK